MNNNTDPVSPPAEIAFFRNRFEAVRNELVRVFVGHDDVVTDLLAALTAEGHILLEGVPGLGKTLLARSLAGALHLSFSRIQFTPDLMPADITGSMQLLEDERGSHKLEFNPGPIHANFVLADEINRATPKTQSALLEAMQEHQVSAGNRTITLPEPFTVIATQNPIEQEGTYPLPEAELDRFLLKLTLGYPKEEEYLRILDLTTGSLNETVKPVCSGEELRNMCRTVRSVIAEGEVKKYAVKLVMATQPGSEYATEETNRCLVRGSGPRGAQALLLIGKVYALLDNRSAVGVDDIRRAALPVLRHRIAFDFAVRERDPDAFLKRLLDKVRP